MKQSSLKEASEYFGLDNAQSSRIISSLEKELDYELLDRSHKPYRLNENFRILEKNLALMVEAHEKILKITQKEEAQNAMANIFFIQPTWEGFQFSTLSYP